MCSLFPSGTSESLWQCQSSLDHHLSPGKEEFYFVPQYIIGSHPSVVRGLHGLPTHGASLVVDVPLLDAGQAVRVRAGQDHVRLPLQADTALLQRGAFEQSR